MLHITLAVNGGDFRMVRKAEGGVTTINLTPTVSLVKGVARPDDLLPQLNELLTELYG